MPPTRPSDKQQAAAMMEDVSSPIRQRRCSPQGSPRFRRMLAILSRMQRHVDELRYAPPANVDPFVAPEQTRHASAGLCHPRPEVAYPAICLPGTGRMRRIQIILALQMVQAGSGSRYALRMQTVEPVIRPDQAGPGIPWQFLLRGLEKV